MKPRPISLSLGTSLLLLVTTMQPTLAQSFSPFYMLGMGQSLLYPLTRVGMMGMPYMGGPYNANPFYSYNSYFRFGGMPNVFPFTNASYGPWGYRNAGMMPGYFNNKNNPNDPNNANNQLQPNAQNEPDTANPGANTMNSANPYQPPPPAYTTPPAPVPSSGGAPAVGVSPAAVGGAGAPPFAYPPQAITAPMQTKAPALQTSPPPLSSGAPPSVAHPPSGSPNFSAAGAAPSGSSAVSPAVPTAGSMAAPGALSSPISPKSVGGPLAEGFINHLNGNYQGDMSKALANPDTRSWARAMGVIGDDVQDGSHLSSDRLDVLGKLLRDDTLDPVSKLDTMRILLKKKSP